MSEVSAGVSDRPGRARSASVERPVDLVHLARMTHGERTLEREVLQLFDRQAATLMARLQAATAKDIPPLAHTLKGSARAIGAGAVARAAEAVEMMDRAPEADLRHSLAALRATTDEARAFIADLLRAH